MTRFSISSFQHLISYTMYTTIHDELKATQRNIMSYAYNYNILFPYVTNYFGIKNNLDYKKIKISFAIFSVNKHLSKCMDYANNYILWINNSVLFVSEVSKCNINNTYEQIA